MRQMETDPKQIAFRQLPLDLPVQVASDRDDLIVSGANRLAVEMIDAWPDWPGPLMLLVGPPGSGKSHIASVWARTCGAQIMPAQDIRANAAPTSNLLVIEDAAHGIVDEAALFHTLNHVRAESGHCLITSHSLPGQWGIVLPDLVSRLRAAQTVTLAAPDDALLSAVMVKLLADRQVEAPASVIEWLLPRMERSLDSARKLVAEMDRQALARGTKITRSVASVALTRVTGGD